MKYLTGIRLTIVVCLTFGALLPAEAESLWRRRSPRHAYVLEDSRARRRGDLLTVIINESTEVDNREDKALNKSTDASGVFDVAAVSSAGFGASSAAANLDMSKQTGRNFTGGATYRNSREFLDRITVTVVGVTSVGNLCISGHRQITIAGEHRMLRISGTVRPVDIGPDNTINSRFIANMETFYEDQGQERHFTRQGWLGRKMNKIWPF